MRAYSGPGIVECFIWREVYPNNQFKYPWDIANFVCDGKRIDKPEIMSDSMFKLVTECWYQQPRERLKISEIIKRLETIYVNEYYGELSDEYM